MAALRVLLDPARMGWEAETLERNLRKRVIGQDHAIRQIVDLYQTYLAGMSGARRPVGNLLFLGPTGSGKTRTVEAVAESLVGDPRALVKVDCAEFQHSHEIAKLIGSPPGYLGHRETHPMLDQDMLDQFHTEKVKLSFVLFDEIEKASDALWNLLLGILDKATLTLGDNRKVDFSRAMIFLTSNLGAGEMSSLLHPNLGFAAGESERLPDEGHRSEKIARAGVEAARRRFTPEFINRIDKTVVFHPLSESDLRQILAIELGLVKDRLLKATRTHSVHLRVDDAAKDFLLEEGTDARYGARHLRRAVERLVVQPLSNLVATGQIQDGDRLFVELDDERKRLAFQKEFRETAPPVEAPTGQTAAA